MIPNVGDKVSLNGRIGVTKEVFPLNRLGSFETHMVTVWFDDEGKDLAHVGSMHLSPAVEARKVVIDVDQQDYLLMYWLRTNLADSVNPLLEAEDWDGLRQFVKTELYDEFDITDERAIEAVVELFIEACE